MPTEAPKSKDARQARPSRRARGKSRGPAGTTSDAIYLAAEDLFFKHGYGGTSLRDIADEVGIQVGSLYNHITSKESMLFAIMESSIQGVLSAVAEATADIDEPTERLRAFMKATIVFYGSNARKAFIGSTEMRSLPDSYRAEIQALRDSYEAQLVEILQQCANAGVDIPDVRMAAYASVAISAHVASWYHPDGELSLDEVADSLIGTYAPLASLTSPVAN
nr:TetR/AcrR family transcriptional regulator [Rhodococcus sp. 15-1154-1]